MTLTILLFAAALAFCLGIISAVLLRIGGLLVVVCAMAALFGFRWFGGYSHPTLVEAIMLLALLQAGYLMGALTPLADRIRRGEPATRLTVKPSDDAE